MTIKEIILEKSFTVGSSNGESTRFKKIRVSLTATLDKKDDEIKVYNSLSEAIEKMREQENKKNKKEFIK